MYLVGAEGLFRVLDRDRSVHRRIAAGSWRVRHSTG